MPYKDKRRQRQASSESGARRRAIKTQTERKAREKDRASIA